MPSTSVRASSRFILVLTLLMTMPVACVRPTLINGGNNGPNPLDNFPNGGNGGNTNGGGTESDDGDQDVDTNGTTPINQLNPFGLEARFTEVTVDSAGWVRVGDDLVVVGTGQGSGVQYFIPSAPSPVAMNISEEETFVVSGFAVTGSWIVLRNFEGEVFVFNAETTALTPLDPDVFAVKGGSPIGKSDFRADEGFVAAVMDRDRTLDDLLLKVISLNGPSPQIIELLQNPPVLAAITDETQTQVAVDGAWPRMAAQVDDQVYIYNLSLNDLAPLTFNYADFGGISNEKPMWLHDLDLMYLARQQSPEGERLIQLARLSFDLTLPAPVSPSPLTDFTLVNGQFGYFAVQSDADRLALQQTRSVFGRTLTSGPLVDSDAINNVAVGDFRDDGVFGFGQTLAITPNGEYRFLAGKGIEDDADLLQISKGATWDVFNDPRSTEEGLLQATSVTASDSVCAFQTGTERSVGFILLD